jgi:hypothetical protein
MWLTDQTSFGRLLLVSEVFVNIFLAVNNSVICCSVLLVASLYGRLSLAARGHGGGRGATESPPYSAFTTDHV